MHDLHGQPERGQRTGGADAEDPSADDHGAARQGGVLGQPDAVREGAQGVHTLAQAPAVRAAQPADGWQQRIGAGGEDEVVPAPAPAVGERQRARAEVHRHHLAAHLQPRPADRQGDRLGVVAAGEHVGEQDPVVGARGSAAKR